MKFASSNLADAHARAIGTHKSDEPCVTRVGLSEVDSTLVTDVTSSKWEGQKYSPPLKSRWYLEVRHCVIYRTHPRRVGVSLRRRALQVQNNLAKHHCEEHIASQ